MEEPDRHFKCKTCGSENYPVKVEVLGVPMWRCEVCGNIQPEKEKNEIRLEK
mgnify:CR=1 FL=1